MDISHAPRIVLHASNMRISFLTRLRADLCYRPDVSVQGGITPCGARGILSRFLDGAYLVRRLVIPEILQDLRRAHPRLEPFVDSDL